MVMAIFWKRGTSLAFITVSIWSVTALSALDSRCLHCCLPCCLSCGWHKTKPGVPSPPTFLLSSSSVLFFSLFFIFSSSLPSVSFTDLLLAFPFINDLFAVPFCIFLPVLNDPLFALFSIFLVPASLLAHLKQLLFTLLPEEHQRPPLWTRLSQQHPSSTPSQNSARMTSTL